MGTTARTGPRFAAVGAVGFMIDAGLLWLLVRGGFDPYTARIFTFTPAVLATWYLNRVWSFPGGRQSRPARQAVSYLALQLVGALVNYGVFVVVLRLFDATAASALLGITAGAIAGLGFNFACARYLVFRKTIGTVARK